jgi:HPt (histidine-containing phosphotransfer) domain-containing protein
LQKDIDEKDYTNLAFHAHSFKGVIGNYMAPEVYELGRKLEELAIAKSPEGIHELFDKLKSSSKDLLFELKNYLQNMEK